MKAIVYEGPGRIAVSERPRPILMGGDALVAVTLSSICGSDLHLLHGQMPGVVPGTVVGHEFVGVVEEVAGDVSGLTPGTRVIGPAAVWCGGCRACQSGRGYACAVRGVFGCGERFGNLDGAQAEFVRVPHAGRLLLPIPENLSDEQVFFVGDVLTTAFLAVTGLTPGNPGLQAGETAAVFGAGPVGLCAIASARLFNPSVLIAVDVEESRLDLARRLGADVTINPRTQDLKTALKAATNGWGVDYAVEAAGSQATLAAAFSGAAVGGRISIVGVFPGPVEFPAHRLIGKNVSVEVGLGDLSRMGRVLNHVAAGELDVGAIITHRLPLADAVRAYEIFDNKEGGAVKVLLTP